MHIGTGELIVGNICRRVLFIIRDEYATLVQVPTCMAHHHICVTSSYEYATLVQVLEA